MKIFDKINTLLGLLSFISLIIFTILMIWNFQWLWFKIAITSGVWFILACLATQLIDKSKKAERKSFKERVGEKLKEKGIL